MTSSLQMNPHTLPHHVILDGTPHGHAHGHGLAKLNKSRSRTHKPILQRLHSHTDRGSLDLDRGWNDQPSPMLASTPSGPYDGPNTLGSFCFPGPSSDPAYRPVRDMAASPLGADLDHRGLADPSRARGAHTRSISGTSLVSIATNTSGGRNGGSFVHPFQQTPQTSLPPLSHAHSRASLEDRDDPDSDSYLGPPPRPREPSPTITEDENDTDAYSLQPSASSVTRFRHHPPSYLAQHRRASQPSQRTTTTTTTTTSTDGSMLLRPPLASHSHTGSIQVLSCESLKQSRSDLGLSAHGSIVDASVTTLTPLGTTTATTAATTTGALGSAAHATASASALAPAPASATVSAAPAQRPAPLPHAPSSGPAASLRSSFDMSTFRIRSRSELDTATRQEHVREARRKFEARERAKEEKYAREETRKRLRADTKEAQKLEREQARLKSDAASRKSSESRSNKVLRRRASRPAPPAELPEDEKASSPGSGGDSPQTQTPKPPPPPPPTADDVHFKSPKRARRAKRRTSKRTTAGMWTAFVLWLRTRLLRLGRR